jgi:dethiobiotin synthetase
MSRPIRLVVCGTDTDVGKTVVSALLVQGLGASYWKPVQSGLDTEGSAGTPATPSPPACDSGRVQALLQLPRERVLPEVYRLQAPASPHWAAELEGCALDPARLDLPPTAGPTATATATSGTTTDADATPLVIETAGGLLVPLTRRWLQIDQLQRWGLPVLLVARSGLGTLNHTLLSLEALRHRRIPVLGLVLNGPPHPDNPRTLAELGGVPVLAELPPLAPLSAAALAQQWQRTGLAHTLPAAFHALP